jgi:hypothetical protein
MSGSRPDGRDLSKLTPELRAALVVELKSWVERAGALTPDELAVLRHILHYAGFGGDGVLVVTELSSLWGGKPSFIPKVHLPADRTRAAVKILRRRGVLKDAEEGAALVDNSVLRALADGTK